MSKISSSLLRERSLEGIAAQGSLIAKSIPLNETGINARAFHYWKNNGLVATVETGKWVRISFIEYLWLKILESMRGFGCPVSLMQTIYQDRFLKAYQDDLGNQNLELNLTYFESLLKMRELEDDEQLLYQNCLAQKNDPLIRAALRSDISYFYQDVLEIFNQQRDLALFIFPDGTYKFTFEVDAIRKSDQPHIFISISYFIAQMLGDESKDKLIMHSGIFSEDEMRVIRELRNTNVDRIIISFGEKGEVKNIDYDKKGLVQGDKVKEVMRILGLRSFDAITLNIRNGTTLSFTKTGKNKIR